MTIILATKRMRKEKQTMFSAMTENVKQNDTAVSYSIRGSTASTA
jgi:hypothetical protein